MKEERQFNKGSHKLKPLQPQEYLHLSRWSIIFQLIPQKSTSEGRVNRRAAAKGMSTTRTRHHELLWLKSILDIKTQKPGNTWELTKNTTA